MDAQYKFLKTVCKLSMGERWVSYAEIKQHWKKCPDRSVLLNLANHSYVEVNGVLFFPNPEAFSYVRHFWQRSIRSARCRSNSWM